MSQLFNQETSITDDRTFRPMDAGGTPAEALISYASQAVSHWRQAIDEMLSWKSRAGQFEPEDQPDALIVDTAIDYAQDQIKAELKEGGHGVSAPSSIIPSGSGRIAMEWNEGPITVTVEFIAQGEGIYTRFKSGKNN